MKKIILPMTIMFMFSCNSTVKNPTKAEIDPDVVISRIDELKERPEWLKESDPFRIENSNVISTGMTTLPASDRVEAGYRIAQNNAKAAIAGSIEQRIEFIFQNAEEGANINSTQARYIGAEATNLVTNSLRPGKYYWEKIATTLDSGERVTRYKIFATVNMPEDDFKKAIFEAIKKSQGKIGLSKNFAEKVDAQWDKFTSDLNKNSQ